MLIKHVVMALAIVPCMAQAAGLESCRFAEIQPGAQRGAVHSAYGQPDRVAGKHLSIDVYSVRDGGEVWVTWMGQGKDERLLYVQHIADVLDTPRACN